MSTSSPYTLEICAASLPSALTAAASGAHRIELCTSLAVGGLTPSHGLIRTVLARVNIPVHVLIRPRAGGFVYTRDEVDIMKADIEACRGLGVAGVVIGVLKVGSEGALVVDEEVCRELADCAEGLDVTFHRAFDDCADQERALEDVIAAGCARVLTSGGQESALDGELRLRTLVKRGGGRLVVMPGGGINSENVGNLYQRTGAKEFHASASRVVVVGEVEMGSRFAVETKETDGDVVGKLIVGLDKAVEKGKA